jgi:hypothetical protein
MPVDLLVASAVILAHAVAALLLSWLYFARWRIARPPLGVFNLTDVAIMLGGILLVPYLYLVVPLWLVAAVLGLAALSAIYITWEALLRARWATWLASLGLVGADVAAALAFGPTSVPFLLTNNVVLIVVVVGTANLWAQAGMKARDAALLGAGLVVYDFVATFQLPLMSDLIERLASLPFAPLVAWPAGESWAGVGLGDLLVAAVFPLVVRKAFGTRPVSQRWSLPSAS